MHVVFRESHGLEETETPVDLGQPPADLVVLSFSDSDFGVFAAGWRRGGGPEGRLPTLRLSNLAALRHPLSVLPADGRPDPRLDAVSTVPASTLQRLGRLCDAGGAVAALAALAQLALVVFYRAYLVAADLQPIEALCAALGAQGFRALGLFVPSLKAPEARSWLAGQVRRLRPAIILNATAFSARDGGGASPLDAAGAPVLQVALSTAARAAWAEAARGLSPADLAMHVVLPEVDGRLFAGVASFKEPGPRDPALHFARVVHTPEPERIAAIATRARAWRRLATAPAADRRVALVLSTYPGRDWNLAHAVGLDALASAEAILADLAAEGYGAAPGAPLAEALPPARLCWPLAAYRAALAALPATLVADLTAAWGAPEDDPDVADGAFAFRALRRGGVIVALQPERGGTQAREAEYHDLARVPRHAYVAFDLWLRGQVDALVHIGAHLTEYSADARQAAGETWLAASAWALDGEAARHDPEGLRARVAAADAFVHAQDLPKTDLLLAEDYASHEAAFAAAQAITGGAARLYHLDNTDPARPRARLLREEIARVVLARAAHPGWIVGMCRHSFRGAAEIAATLENLAAFAHLAGVVAPHLFDAFWEATLGDEAVTAFLATANPGALAAMQTRFAELHAAGLWRTRRNSIRARLEGRA